MRTVINLHCKHCGCKYERRLGREQRSKYCSRRCHALDLIAGKNHYPRWIKVSDQPPNKKDKILVFCKGCKLTHSVYNDYDEWSLAEWCSKGQWQGPSDTIYFDYWMPMPKPPKELRKKLTETKE